MPNQYEVDPSVECVCGRLKTRIHCPRCGVYTVYARSTKKNTIRYADNGEALSLRTFSCRRCGQVFDEHEWQTSCTAPRPIRPPTLEQKLEEKARLTAKPGSVASRDLTSEADIPEKFRRALEEVRKKRGM